MGRRWVGLHVGEGVFATELKRWFYTCTYRLALFSKGA